MNRWKRSPSRRCRVSKSRPWKAGWTVCQLTIRGEATLPPKLHVAVYRIVQEALTNVSRHAKASSAWVLLESRPGHVHLSVEDNGTGFDPATVDRSHMGLRTMQERAGETGATLSVSARTGGGTIVRLEWEEEQVAHS